ncbi:hypothetical protein J6590_029105 [Homalodisca vitripennis]|nr:hypothetical protein J6590_029105 [Homalodisca vitripennis]
MKNLETGGRQGGKTDKVPPFGGRQVLRRTRQKLVKASKRHAWNENMYINFTCFHIDSNSISNWDSMTNLTSLRNVVSDDGKTLTLPQD